MELLSSSGFRCDALCGAKLETDGDASVEKLLDDLKLPYDTKSKGTVLRARRTDVHAVRKRPNHSVPEAI